MTPQYVQELKNRGQVRLTVDELIALRDRGLTSDRLRTFEHILYVHLRSIRNGLVYLWPK